MKEDFKTLTSANKKKQTTPFKLIKKRSEKKNLGVS
jgi:hypothetical protein